MTVGDKLAALRKQNNYTQEQLAEILNVSRQSVSRWESDLAYPETDKLIKLSQLYHCSVDYLLKDGAAELQSFGNTKAHALGSALLKFAPSTLFLVWAALLWAFFAIDVLISGTSVYALLTSVVMRDLLPTLVALTAIAGVSVLYGAANVAVQARVGGRTSALMNICAFLLQIAVIVCVAVLAGFVAYLKLNGGYIVTTSVVTAVFVLLQTVCLLLRNYLDDSAGQTSRQLRSDARRCGKFLWAHRTVTLTVAAAVLACAVLATMLPLTVGDRLTLQRVQQISVGDSREEVFELLGEPHSVFGADGELCSWSKGMSQRYLDEQERMQSFYGTNGLAEAELYAIKTEMLNKVRGIREISVLFGNDGVIAVYFDNDTSKVQKSEYGSDCEIRLTPDVIPRGQTPAHTQFGYTVFYGDGSYLSGKFDSPQIVSSDPDGWVIEWSDIWGNYRYVVREESGDELVARGNLNSLVGFGVTRVDDGYSVYLTEFYGDLDDWGDISVYLPDTVEVIVGSELGFVPAGFADCPRLTRAVLSDGVTSVDGGAFARCTALSQLILPDGMEQIDEGAFEGCTSLTSLTLNGNGELQVGRRAFAGCTSLRTLQMSGVGDLGERAFADCTQLNDLRINNNATPYGNYALYLDIAVFEDCAALQNAVIRSSAPVVFYGEAFYGDGELSELSVEVPEDVTIQFLSPCFEGCTSLQRVALHGECEIGDNVFAYCASLVELDCGNGKLVRVGYGAFVGCSRLASVNMNFGSGLKYGLYREDDFGYDSFALELTVTNGQDAVRWLTQSPNYADYLWKFTLD